MPISRFEKFKPVDFQQVPIYTPDFELIDQTMGQVQSEYDQGRAKIEEASFKNLGADKMRSKELRDGQNQMTDDISAQYRDGIGKGRRAMAQGLVDLSRDYKDGGERYQINKNYQSFMSQRDDLKKRIGKPGGITQGQMSAWENYTLNGYKTQGGATADDFGMFGGIPMDDVAAYVDGNKKAEEIAKNWKANKKSSGQWTESNGKFYKKTKKGTTEVSYDEIMQGTLNALRSDPELTNYLQNFAKHEGREIDLTNMGYQNKDASYTYNMQNPLVRYANTPARKWSYRETEYDEDLKIDSYRLADYTQGLKEKAENRQHNFLTHSSLAGGWQKETAANLDVTNSDIQGLEDSIAKAEKEIAANPNMLPIAKAKANAHILRQKVILSNKLGNRDATLTRIAPGYANEVKAADGALSAAGISNSQNKTAIEAATTYQTQQSDGSSINTGGGGSVYKTVNHNVELTIENLSNPDTGTGMVERYMAATGLKQQDAQKILMQQALVKQSRRGVDKGYHAALRGTEEQNMVAVPMISLNTNEKEGGRNTVAGAASQHITDTPGSYIFMGDDGTTMQGVNFKEKIAEQYAAQGVKIDFTKGRATNLVLNDNTLVGTEQLKGDTQVRYTIPYTDAAGISQSLNFTVGAVDGASEQVVKALGDDIIATTSSQVNAQTIINHRNRIKDLDGAYNLFDNGVTQEVRVGLALQSGQNPNSDFKEILTTRKKLASNSNFDQYNVSFGNNEAGFSTSNEAKRYTEQVRRLSQIIMNNKDEAEALKLVKNTIGFDSEFTEEVAKSLIGYIKS